MHPSISFLSTCCPSSPTIFLVLQGQLLVNRYFYSINFVDISVYVGRDREKECASKAGLRPQKVTRGSTPTQPTQLDPELTCCSHDMCNYRDFDVYIQVDRGGLNSQTGRVNEVQ